MVFHWLADIVLDILFNEKVQVLWLHGGMPELLEEIGGVVALPGGRNLVIHVMIMAPLPAPPPVVIQLD